MTDSIGSMGVILTMITIFFTLWQPETNEKLSVNTDLEQGNEVIINDLKGFINFKINILLFGSLIIFIIMGFDIIIIIRKMIRLFKIEGFSAIKHYKSIYPIYSLLWIFSFILFKYIRSIKKEIKDKIKKLEV